ncbi:unnamed protein product [Caenorhabditis angaria]|uniref:Transcription factor CBF/NF-Y/archaeal histone domain-containing protein n=1 Tax=Caenorhabditis angaria TaxID=860376 RepID=A0A9P1IB06_9PELO|nr:unnamed protein product [Caenorhabditis angaria]
MVYSKRNANQENRRSRQNEEDEDDEDDTQMDAGTSSQPQNAQQKNASTSRAMETFTFQSLDWKSMLSKFWVEQKTRASRTTQNDMRERCKHMALPMARVKKIMRIDDEVRSLMIAADAPFFLAAAGEMFVEEVTSLAWQIVEITRRRTMQKSDVVTALQKVEQFDFLIDIIPRDRTIRQTYTIPHPRDYQPPQNQQDEQQPNQNDIPNEDNYEPPVNEQAQNGEFMQEIENVYEPNVTTITVDEHGNPIGNIPQGYQIVIQNGNEQQPQQDYSTIQNGSSETGNGAIYTYNGQTYHIVHIADGNETSYQ